MKKLLVPVIVVSLLLFACKGSGVSNEEELPSAKFWAQNLSSLTFYQVDAQKLAINSICEVWAEKGSGVTKEQAQSIADEYKLNIYQKMIDTFGFTKYTSEGKDYDINTMDFADLLSKVPDSKLCILLLDIKDDYKEGVNDSYVAGYFWPGDFMDISNSNLCDMIYIDTNPGLKTGTEVACITLAHEMQHLMNFVSSVVYRSVTVDKLTYVNSMDTWIDEGLSSAAEWLYLGGHEESRLNWYNKNGDGKEMKGLIDKGNNFFVWNNRGDESGYAVLDDYATVYLFFQWLRLQTGDTGIYKDIITSNSSDYQAVTDTINKEWETLLETWLAANLINSVTGDYGYRDDDMLKNVKAIYAPAPAPGGSKDILLYPGEGVYSVTKTDPSYTDSGNIKYVYLTSTGPQNSFITDNTLLTYNVNKINIEIDDEGNIKDLREKGKITGEDPPAPTPSASVSFSGARSIGSAAGPFPISAGDMLRRKGRKENLKIQFDYRGIKIDE